MRKYRIYSLICKRISTKNIRDHLLKEHPELEDIKNWVTPLVVADKVEDRGNTGVARYLRNLGEERFRQQLNQFYYDIRGLLMPEGNGRSRMVYWQHEQKEAPEVYLLYEKIRKSKGSTVPQILQALKQLVHYIKKMPLLDHYTKSIDYIEFDPITNDFVNKPGESLEFIRPRDQIVTDLENFIKEGIGIYNSLTMGYAGLRVTYYTKEPIQNIDYRQDRMFGRTPRKRRK